MAETTKIEWANSTLNVWEGCQETASPACLGCYARERNLRYAPKGTTEAPNWGPHAPRREVKSWRKTLRKIELMAAAASEPWFVFVNSLSDFFDNQADAKLRADALLAFALRPHVTFLLLTKRPQNIVKMVRAIYGPEVDLCDVWPKNVAIGCTVVTQAEADRYLPVLKRAFDELRPAFAFVSIEPMVEDIDIEEHLAQGFIGWVIAGGGTDQGKVKAEPTDPMAFINLQMECEDAGVPFLFKQWGEWVGADPKNIEEVNDGRSRRMKSGMWVRRVGKNAAGRTLRGRTYDARPQVAA